MGNHVHVLVTIKKNLSAHGACIPLKKRKISVSKAGKAITQNRDKVNIELGFS